jgi:hypothetical protein
MKILITLALVLLTQVVAFSQSDIKKISASSWAPGSSKVIYGSEIKKLEGKNGTFQGITNVAFRSPEYFRDDYKKTAAEEMWTSEQLEDALNEIENSYPGGMVVLYILRSTRGSADTDNFTIIIKNSNEEEIFRETLEDDFPEYSNGNYWNFGYVSITEKLTGKNYIYVVDAFGDSNNKIFKFELNLEEMP